MAKSSLPAPVRAIVGLLTLVLRAAQCVVAAGLIYFIVCQGTMLAKEQKYIKKVPGYVTEGPHCSFVAEQGWSAKYPALGCHKRAFNLRDLVKIAPPLKWTPTDLAAMAEKRSPYGVQDLLAARLARWSKVLTSTQAAVVGATCTHVATGPKLAVDHRGFLCFLEQLQPESGCCGTAHLGRFNCDGCELQTEGGVCCLEFERCVSCCIGASGTDASATVELALTLEGCVGRCRTASKSLDGKVWNRYRSERKYCNGSGGEGVDGDGDP